MGGRLGLDVDVGSLTRYHTRAPADVVERIARHQEMAVTDGRDAEEVIRARCCARGRT
jgi:hypothetical protein